ncbi:MAG TPA: dihydroneopterin aldolase [Candidatus Limosilactobacillus faecipullorum]|nr:dihydroneopterin aldolase [Candidatus Limosilactobacillus faecipullorum]
MGWIRIKSMVFHTFNGVLPEEKKLGQRLEADIELNFPIEKQVLHDNLNETVNYAAVYETVETFIKTHNYDLIESLANRVADEVLTNYPQVKTVKVRIRKYAVPINGIFDHVEVEVEKQNG